MERHVFDHRTSADPTAGNACWETPPAVFEAIEREWGRFDLDLCADAKNALCPQWIGPGSDLAEDAVGANWSAWGRSGFGNPPYGRSVPAMLEAAAVQATLRFESVWLLPMRVTQAWFIPWVLGRAAELRFCSSRITFYEGGRPRLDSKGRPSPAPFDSILVRFGPGLGRVEVGVFTIPKHP